MVVYTVVNTTGTQFTDINIGGYDVPPRTIATGVTLTAAELATAVGLAGCLVVKDGLKDNLTGSGPRNPWRNLVRGLKYYKTVVGA